MNTKKKAKERSEESSGSTRKRLTSQRLLSNRPVDEPEPKPTQDDAASVEQRQLLAPPEEAVRPAPVQNGRIHASYNGLGLERTKDGGKLVHLDFSFVLENDHDQDSLLPEKAVQAWHYLQRTGEKGVMLNGIPAVTLDVWLEPKSKKPELHLAGAEFSKATVQIIEEVGKGKAQKVTRFAFRLLVERDKDVIDFAAWHDGEEFWLTMPETQGTL